MSRFEPEHKNDQRHGTNKENGVSGHSHPAQVLHDGRLHELAAACIPVTMLNRGPGLHQSDRQQTQHAHCHQPAVQRPERESQQTVFPLTTGDQDSQAEEHQAHAQHSVHAKQCGVTVQRSRVEALHVVQSNGWVNHEAEQSGSDHVPEGN